MMNITLKQLRYFDALSLHGHFGRAAAASSITQPALSAQIKDLEEGLGLALFERSHRQVRLTSFGEEFAGRVRVILQAVDELVDLTRASAGGLTGPIRAGIIPTIAPYLLPAVIRRLDQSYPDLDIHVSESMTSRLLEELSAGRLDFAIVALPISEPSIREVPLFSENFVLIRPLADKDAPPPDREALKEMRLLLLEEGHCFRDQALSFCDFKTALPRPLMDGSSLSTLVQMVAAGIGVTLIPEMAIPVETRATPVSVSRFPEPQPARTIGMIWRTTNPLSRQLMDVARVVKYCARELIATHASEQEPDS